MKRKIRRFICSLIVCSLVFSMAGCEKEKTKNKKKTGESAKGRYVEKLLTVPEGYQGKGSLNMLQDGSLILIDSENGIVSKSSDNGTTWKKYKQQLPKELIGKDSLEITSTAAAPDGGLFFSYISWGDSSDKKPYPEKFVYFDKRGNKTEFELGIDDYSAQAFKAVFTEKSQLFLACNNNAVYEVNLKKQNAEKKLQVEDSLNFGMFRYGDAIAVAGGNKVYVYDTKSGEMNASDEVLNSFVEKECKNSDAVIFGGNDKEKILAVSQTGIYSHVLNGGIMEQLAEGSLLSLGDPSHVPADLFVTQKDTILILYQNGELDAYSYDAGASTVPEHQLTLYSLYDNDTVRQAISIFRQSHPDVYVKMETGLTGEDGVTASDAIKNLNTELLAGKGPDILVLDGMPLDSYIEKGTLLNMEDIVQELENDSQYYKEILESYQKEGKIYAVPARFSLPLLTGEKNVMAKISDITSLADAAEQQADLQTTKETVLGCYRAEELLERLYPVCEAAWYKEDNSIDQEALVEFLTQTKRIYQAEQKNLDEAEIEDYNKTLKALEKIQKGKINSKTGMTGVYQLQRRISGIQCFTEGFYKSMSEIQNLLAIQKTIKKDTYQLFQGQAKNVFIPSGIMGITANTEEKDLATEFIKTILGVRVQGKDLEDGFPVNKDAFTSFSKNPNGETDAGLMISDGGEGEEPFELDLKWPSKGELDELEKQIETLDTPADLNSSIQENVIDIGVEVLKGEKGIEDGAEEISQKIALLNEE